jgi:uncharacterized protein (DUF983 family)
MADRSRCPNCGERVSPYAAGCAICGADLDTRRWGTGPSKIKQADSWLSSLSFGQRRNLPVWAVLIVILFGGSIISFLYVLISGALN